MINDDDEIIVVTARCIDVAACRDNTDKKPCIDCGEMVWLSHSWKGKKIDKVICEHCFEKEKYQNHDYSAHISDEVMDDVTEIIKRRGSQLPDDEIKEMMIKVLESRIGKKVNITNY